MDISKQASKIDSIFSPPSNDKISGLSKTVSINRLTSTWLGAFGYDLTAITLESHHS